MDMWTLVTLFSLLLFIQNDPSVLMTDKKKKKNTEFF